MKFDDDDVALMVSSDERKNTQCDQSWYIDSAATSHMTFNNDNLFDYTEYKKPRTVSLGDDYYISSVGDGKLRLPIIDENGCLRHLALNRVLYVPNLAKNLLSVRVMTENKAAVIFDDNSISPSKRDVVIFRKRFSVKLTWVYRNHAKK